MQPATRRSALRKMPRRFTECPVPEQGLVYRLRNLNEAERQQYVRNCEHSRDDGRDCSRELLIVACVIDPQGAPLFQSDDVTALSGELLDSAVTTRLFEACLTHCAFEAGNVEDLKKNSPRIPTDDSRLNSPGVAAAPTSTDSSPS